MIDRATNPLTYRLTAIAFADVAQYTRHMDTDGEATIRHWAELRETVLYPQMDRFSGKYINEAGDAVLAEFPSATAAISWALAVQKEMGALPADRNDMQIRIGINVDDVIDNGETIQSDGVIVAARIHEIAAPGEIVVTQLTRDIVRGRLKVSFRDLGAPPLKNIDRPVRVFAVEEKTPDTALVRPHSSWSSRPTLAVLPFRDLLGVDEDRYFGEGITEDIITGVSRSRAMFVVARNSTLQFGDSSKSQKEIARALGVKYLLTGSIRRQSNILRINTELTDVDRSRTVWAEKFDGLTSDLFEFQDRIASSIVAALEPKVQSAEMSKLGARTTESLDAYDCVLRALSELYRLEGPTYSQARALLTRAVSLDSGYAQAHSYLAWCLNFIIAEGRSSNVVEDRRLAMEHAVRAVDLDPTDAFNLSIRAHILGLIEGEPYQAVDMLDEALHLNENLPIAWALSATSHAYLGHGEEARDRLLNVWKLTPYDPLNFFFWTSGGLAEFVAGDYEEAVRMLQRARHAKPHFVANLRILAASLGMAGQIAEAQAVARELLAEDPDFSIDGFVSWYPLKNPDNREKLVMGLSAAGLPRVSESQSACGAYD